MAALAAAMDPTKWSFPRDLGSGKLFPFFFGGAGMTFAALVTQSPFGKKMIAVYRDSQAQIQQAKREIEEAKKPPPGGPPG